MTKPIKFVSTISNMRPRKIINIPPGIFEMIKDLEGKKILVTIEES